MGIALAFYSVSDDNIDQLHSNPPLIWRLIEPDDGDMYLDSLATENRPGFLGRLFGKKQSKESQEVPSLTFVAGEGKEDDIDKSWQGIHFCLNLTAYDAEPPLDFLAGGGDEVGNVDVGYGPARSFKAAVVKDLAERLSAVSIQSLKDNYNPEKMSELDIYPDIWERDGDEGLEYIVENYERLRAFLNHCTEHGLGAVFHFC